MRTVIVGCGRVGSSLARQLSEEGDDVAVVDSSEAAFNRLGEEFAGEMVFGSAVDEDILRRAGPDPAAALVGGPHPHSTKILAGPPPRRKVRGEKGSCPGYVPAPTGGLSQPRLGTLSP